MIQPDNERISDRLKKGQNIRLLQIFLIRISNQIEFVT